MREFISTLERGQLDPVQGRDVFATRSVRGWWTFSKFDYKYVQNSLTTAQFSAASHETGQYTDERKKAVV